LPGAHYLVFYCPTWRARVVGAFPRNVRAILRGRSRCSGAVKD
jgi:hypothetical protein